MGRTDLSIKGQDFYINGQKVYSEISGSNESTHGLLMNARFIQGIFDDKADRKRFNRFGKEFNPETNTGDLIAVLPQWYRYGLRAFTTGFQGGGPCFTISNTTIKNNPFGEDGLSLDSEYGKRMDRLVRAADEIGIVVIVSFFYQGQLPRLRDGRAIANAVRTASRFLRENRYTNVIIEVCNEMDVDNSHAIVHQPEGMALLIEIAREESGGMPVSCSFGGGVFFQEVCEASDVVLFHGNGCSRQRYYELIRRVRECTSEKPILCNEDSQAIGQLEVSYKTHTSWGYYNNMTKQEPPVDWSITEGEDRFFAWRMAKGIGIDVEEIPSEEQYYLQGLENDAEYDGKRWVRLASLYPERINYVDFYLNGKLVYTCYDEPFTVNWEKNWRQRGWIIGKGNNNWKADIHLTDGKIIEREKSITV